MSGSNKTVLLACGSFNPPTNMHLRIFELARDFLHRNTDYRVVAGLLSPVHDKYGKENLASANERLQMIQLAVASSQWLHASDWETRQDGWTPTREVLQHHQDLVDSTVNGNVDGSAKRQRLDSNATWLNQICNSSDPIKVKLLCGADLLQSFSRPGLWKKEDIETIIGKFGLVIISRSDCDPYKFIYESDLLSKYQKNIHIVTNWIPNEVSSTKVRMALRRAESVKYLLQDSVIDYIYKHSLFQTHNNKYIISANMLTPSPNPDRDVLLPPPNSFTLASSSHHLGAMLTRQHARQSSTPSDIEQDTPPGVSPSDVNAGNPPPVPPRMYPGLAIPILPKSDAEVGGEMLVARRVDARSMLHSLYASTQAPVRPPHKGRDLLDRDQAPILKSVGNREVKVQPPFAAERGRAIAKPVINRSAMSNMTNQPSLLKSRSISPKKATAFDSHPNKKAFATHVRSKSSISLKPERSYESYQKTREELLSSLRDTYTRSLSTGSYIYDILSRNLRISPSHTEICLSHVPIKKIEKPIGPRGKNGDRLFTSRSLERPSTPRYDRSLSPSRKVVSLPISRGRSRDRSQSPSLNDFEESIAELRGTNIIIPNSLRKGELPRSLTHEEEINLIISGDTNILRMTTPDSFPSIDLQSSESIVSNESEYEMRF